MLRHYLRQKAIRFGLLRKLLSRDELLRRRLLNLSLWDFRTYVLHRIRCEFDLLMLWRLLVILGRGHRDSLDAETGQVEPIHVHFVVNFLELRRASDQRNQCVSLLWRRNKLVSRFHYDLRHLRLIVIALLLQGGRYVTVSDRCQDLPLTQVLILMRRLERIPSLA